MRSLPIVRKLVSASILAMIFAAATAAQNPQLSLADLLIGLRSKKATIEERNQILSRAVMERGVTFVNTPEIEKELVSTGADQHLLAAVRTKSVKPAPVATPTPAPKPTPTPAEFYSKRADASLEKGQVDSALADYTEALKLKTDDPDLYISRGKALFTKKDFDRSVKDYDKAIELAPKTAIAFLNRGASYEQLGDVQKALNDYKSAASLEPSSDTAKAEVKRIEDQLAKAAAEKEAAEREAAAKAAAAIVPEFLNLGSLSSENAERLVTPTYPAMARQSRIIGKVTVEVDLDAEGNVTKAEANSGHSMLRQASEDAAKRSKFKPALYNGKPIKAKGIITYSFSL
jgi:TonB family protein